MRIKNYKLFLESLDQSIYLDDEYIFHGYFISFYDEFYTFEMIKGWSDENNVFRVMTPGKNRKLAYSIKLINAGSKSKVNLKEDYEYALEMLKSDGFEILKTKFNEHTGSFSIDISSSEIKDITIEDICKELNITTQEYKSADDLIKDMLENTEIKKIGGRKQYYNKDDIKMMEEYVEWASFYVIYNEIWSFFSKIMNNITRTSLLLRIILDSNLNRRVGIATFL